MSFEAGVIGGAGKTSTPVPIKKARYKVGIKRIPDQTPVQIPVFTNGKFGVIESIEKARYEGKISEFEVPIYFAPDVETELAINSEAKASMNIKKTKVPHQIMTFLQRIEVLLSDNEKERSSMYNMLKPVMKDIFTTYGIDPYKPTLFNVINKIVPKINDTEMVIYDAKEDLHLMWTRWAFTHAVDMVQYYISSQLLNPFRFKVKAVPYGAATYKVINVVGKKDESSTIATLQFVEGPGTHFKFFEHRGYISNNKIRNNTEKEDRVTYTYTYLVGRLLQKFLGNTVDELDSMALASEIISSLGSYGLTSIPDEWPTKADDLYTQFIENVGLNITRAYPFINFSSATLLELVEFWIILTLAVNRIKIPTTKVTFEMITRDWERVDTNIHDVIKPELPGIGSDATPYLIMADNMCYIDSDEHQGIFLPYRITKEVYNKYHEMKELNEVPNFNSSIVVKNGEIEGNPLEPLDKTTAYFNYKLSNDVKMTEIKYKRDIVMDFKFPRHNWAVDLYTEDSQKMLYIMSLMSNGEVQYADGLVVSSFPNLLGYIPVVYRSINTEDYSTQTTEAVNTLTGAVSKVDKKEMLMQPGAPAASMTDPMLVPQKQETVMVKPIDKGQVQADTDAGQVGKPNIIKTDGVNEKSNEGGSQ